MTKTFKGILFTLGTVVSTSTVLVSLVSCAADPNSAIRPRDGGKLAYTIYLKNGKKISVTFKEFMAYLKNHPGPNTSMQLQYDNQIIKWLYKDEQNASVKAHAKDTSIAQLTSYDDVYSNAKKKLANSKKSIKKQYGVNWEPEWAKALLSSQYGQALSEDQAVEYLAVQTMKPDALKRFTLKIDSTTYKASDITDGNHPYLQGLAPGTPVGDKNINAIASNDNTKQVTPAIALITSSYDDNYKSPDQLLKTYMTKYKTALNIRHVLYALKVGKIPSDPWTLKTDSIAKLFGNINNGDLTSKPLAWQNLANLKDTDANKANWAADPLADSSAIQGSLVGKILSNYSDNGGAAKTYGALGMTSLYDDVKTLVPGFAIPIGAADSGITGLPAKIVPKPVDLNMDTALEASGDPIWSGTKLPSMDTNIQTDITRVLGDATKLEKVLTALKNQLSTNGTRSLEYTLTNTGAAAAAQTHAVFSSDGLHMIYQEKVQYNNTQKDGGLNTWMYNDLIKTRDADPLIYNIIKEVNSKQAPTDNFSNIYPLVENYPKPSYPKAQTLSDFVKSQPNYANEGNPKFTDADINTAKSISNILVTTKKETDILTLQKKYQTWWDTNVLTKLIDPGTLTWPDVNNMIRKLGEQN